MYKLGIKSVLFLKIKSFTKLLKIIHNLFLNKKFYFYKHIQHILKLSTFPPHYHS